MEIKDILRKLIAFNTVDDKDNEPLVLWLADFLRPLGFKIEFISNKNDERKILRATIGEKPKLGFLCHTDTVLPGAEWKSDPFVMTEKEGYIYGLGASDMKGGIAACLSAVSGIDWKKQKRGLELIFTYDEEKGFAGIKNFIEKNKIGVKYLIVPEPTDMVPVSAAKGCVEFKFDFEGVSSHASYPKKGRNAILMANDFILRFISFFSKEIAIGKNPAFLEESATFNIAKIDGGDAINKVPDRCHLEIECRTINLDQNQEIYKGILDLLDDVPCRVEMGYPLPSFFSDNNNFFSFFEGVSGKGRQAFNYTTEANFLLNSCDTVIIGPGPVTAHESNEHISMESLNEAREMYKLAIERYN